MEDKSARKSISPHHYGSAEAYTYRTDFHEFWLWENITLPKTGVFKLRTSTPDSITSWYITGFSIDPVRGFGIIKTPLIITTSLPFYIVESLPYSIRRGEAVVLQFTLFNTLGSDCHTSVTLIKNKDQFDFVAVSGVGKTK